MDAIGALAESVPGVGTRFVQVEVELRAVHLVPFLLLRRLCQPDLRAFEVVVGVERHGEAHGIVEILAVVDIGPGNL